MLKFLYIAFLSGRITSKALPVYLFFTESIDLFFKLPFFTFAA
jgi:hypothetical protein